jgi:hypothetical protein
MEETLLNEYTEINNNSRSSLSEKNKCKINWSYILILFISITTLIINIIIFIYFTNIIALAQKYKEEIDQQHIPEYLNKFKHIVDYFCDNMVDCK